MKRKLLAGVVSLILLACLMGCAGETPWRKATVSTYELLGAGIGTTEGVTNVLRSQNVITDEQVLKVKEIYHKAVAIYTLAGNSLKLAGRASSATERDKFLEEYNKLLADFNVLTKQLFDLINSFKKVSLLEGGEPCKF